jgi:hypothetical protein
VVGVNAVWFSDLKGIYSLSYFLSYKTVLYRITDQEEEEMSAEQAEIELKFGTD